MTRRKTANTDARPHDRAIGVVASLACAVASILVLQHTAGCFVDEYLSLRRTNVLFGHQDPQFTSSYAPALACFSSSSPGAILGNAFAHAVLICDYPRSA